MEINETYESKGIKYRRKKGKKHSEDFPMEINTGNAWIIPTNELVLKMIEVICDNEENIYPQSERSKLTGRKLSGCGMFISEVNNILAKYNFFISSFFKQTLKELVFQLQKENPGEEIVLDGKVIVWKPKHL